MRHRSRTQASTDLLRKFVLIVFFFCAGTLTLFAEKTITVGWESSADKALTDSNGVPLSKGSPAEQDGCVLQLGYYSEGTSSMPFAGVFIPLTGEGSANSGFRTTSIGDSGNGAAGKFSIQNIFEDGSPERGSSLPSAGTPLAIRFFSSSSISNSTHYNAVSAGALWQWRTPSEIPGELIVISLDDENLQWLGGFSSAYKTTLPALVSVITQPLSQNVNLNSGVTLAVDVQGMSPVTFQWRKNAQPILGATSSSLTIANFSQDAAGLYDVQITNPAGTILSDAVTIGLNIAPTIITQPSSVLRRSGETVSLSLSVSGTPPLSYQWYKDEQPISEATLSSYSLPNAQTTDSGTYKVITSNSAGSVISGFATVSILDPPMVAISPQSATLSVGTSFSITATVSGSPPLSFQWYKDGTPIVGATLSTYGLSNAQITDSGSYQLAVSNPVSTVTSGSATVSVLDPPIVSISPQSTTHSVGGSLSITATVSGSPPLSLQWYKDGNPIVGATLSTYALSSAQITDSGSYQLAASNPVSTVTSGSATVSVLDPPIASISPQSTTLSVGGSLSITATVSGSPPLSLQWYKDGNPIVGATLSTYGLSNAQITDSGSYQLAASNPVSTVTSGSATLSVFDSTVVSISPDYTTLNVGGSFSITATVSGSTPLSFQWYKDGNLIAGATLLSYTLSNARITDGGSYQVATSYANGSFTSGSATISVLAPPIVSIFTASATLCAGSAFSVTGTVSGSTPLLLQWRKNGVPIENAESQIFNIPTVQLSDSGTYDLMASNEAATATSNPVVLRVLSPVSINRQPASSLASPGSAVTLSVEASGSPPYSYQWHKNGVAITGANQSTYTIGAMRAELEGAYRVTIQNEVSSAVSSVAVVQSSKLRGIFILKQPAATSFLQRTQATTTISLEPLHQRIIYDRCQIYSYEDGQSRLPIGPLINVPFSGQLKLPLQQITHSGKYMVRFMRLYADGQYFSLESAPFDICVIPWENVAGRYEVLLEREDTEPIDSAKYSGALFAYVSSRGSISGRIVYDEAETTEAPDPRSRTLAYTSVSRTFCGALTPDSASPNTLKFRTTIPSRSPAIMQEVELSLEYGGENPTLRATFKDHASIKPLERAGGLVSTSGQSARCLQSIPPKVFSAVSRYSICADPNTNGGAMFINTLTSDARLLWVSRARHGIGSGAASIKQREYENLESIIYQRTFCTSGSTAATTSAMGPITIGKSLSGAWTAWFGDHANPSLEQHLSFIEYPSRISRLPAPSHTSYVSLMEFDDAQNTRWTSLERLQFLQIPQQQWKLFIQEPAFGTDGMPLEKEWPLTATNNGIFVVATGIGLDVIAAPQVHLTFNPAIGTFSGFYKPNEQPSQLMFGGMISSIQKPELRAQGWIQPLADFKQPCAIWRIERVP